MSLEHAPQRQRRKRGPHKRRPIERVCVSPEEFSRATGISVPTLYRWMAEDPPRLRYTQVGERMRKIPTTEYSRLGLIGDAVEPA
jgi:hypothetical protein